jgi:3-oxoacyl-(acyl-carrier-protein) synthase
MQVFVTGMGIVSAIGNGVNQNLASLRNSKTGVELSNYTFHEGSSLYAGEVKYSNDGLKELLDQPASARISRTSLLAAIAMQETLSSLPKKFFNALPFINGTTIGGMDITEKFYSTYLSDPQMADFSLLLTHDSGDTTEKTAALLGLQGFITTISTACSSSANSIMMAGRILREGRYHRAIAGGTDALTSFTLNGFRSLGIYDKTLCRPFDINRAGLNLGEGAAYLLLETEASIKETGNQPLAILSGWGNANDAYHQTASSPEGNGATMAMQSALSCAKLDAGKISYVNAHGTGTGNNDLSESKALMNIFGDKLPPFSSTKAFTGHTLAAAGAVEAVYSILSLQGGILFPNLHFNTPIQECGLVPVSKYEQGKEVNYVLSNSFGFGGNNSSLIFQKV